MCCLQDFKGVWCVGSDMAKIQKVMDASSSVRDTPYVHFPLHAWQQRYSSRPLATQETRDTHNSGLQPSTIWIGNSAPQCMMAVLTSQRVSLLAGFSESSCNAAGITTALECARAGAQLHVLGMSMSQNLSQPSIFDAKAEQEWLFNLDALGLIEFHHLPCNVTDGCPALPQQEAVFRSLKIESEPVPQSSVRLYPHGLKQLAPNLRLYLTSSDVRED